MIHPDLAPLILKVLPHEDDIKDLAYGPLFDKVKCGVNPVRTRFQIS